MSTSLNTVTADGYIRMIRLAREVKHNLLVLGIPGGGKSQMPRQLAAADDLNFYATNVSQEDIIDNRGVCMPNVADNRTNWLMPDLRARMWDDADENGVNNCILLKDELPAASKSVMNVNLQDADESRSCGHDLPEGCTIVFTGNNASDRNTQFNLNPVFGNRVMLIQYDGPTHKEWLTYVLHHGLVHPMVAAAINMYPALMHDYDAQEFRNPTPRSWVRCSQALGALERQGGTALQDHRMCVTASYVGDAAALKAEGILRLYDDMTPYDVLLKDPHGAAVPDPGNMQAQFMMASLLATRCYAETPDNERLNPKEFSAVCTYAKRLNPEMAAVAIIPITRRKKELCITKEFASFSGDFQGLFNAAL